jgi:hypothetical protein
MNTVARWFVSILFVTALLAGASYLRPDWAIALGIDLEDLPRLQARIEREQRRQADLDEQEERALRHVAQRHEVVDRLIGGRLSLLEAAARFRDLTVDSPECLRYLRNRFPGASDEECFCRQVIGWVEIELKDRSPADVPRVVGRLEAELQEHRSRDGKVSLPG